jgi:hypothetical protein
MLLIGEKVGSSKDQPGALSVDIAVDPLEGTNLCATGAGGAITVLAASERGGLLHAPDRYMEKIVVGPAAKGAVDLEAPVKHNLKAIARRLAARGGRFGGGGARPAAPRATDCGYPGSRRAHPSDRGWRPFGGHRGRGGRHRRTPGEWGPAARPKACSPPRRCAA